jgi:hypothetical protein
MLLSIGLTGFLLLGSQQIYFFVQTQDWAHALKGLIDGDRLLPLFQ